MGRRREGLQCLGYVLEGGGVWFLPVALAGNKYLSPSSSGKSDLVALPTTS